MCSKRVASVVIRTLAYLQSTNNLIFTCMPKKISEKKAWKVTAARMVGYIDIMGFKDLVLKHSHKEMYGKMLSLSKMIKDHEDTTIIFDDENLIKTTMYSDSIIIYSKNNSKDAVIAFLLSISFIENNLFKSGLPFKGAVAYGTMSLDIEKSIFFGQPLIDAYLLQEDVYFYGIVAHATAEKFIQERGCSDYYLHDYSCPFKQGYATHATIHPAWINDKDSRVSDNGYKELIKAFNLQKYNTSGHLRRYIDNTKSYFDSFYK